MQTKILVVDDSTFFCQQLIHILNSDPQLKVVGVATNGKEAIEKVAQIKPDIVTMDVEMPVMDGITAVKHIMQTNPVPVLMLSSLTYEGAKLTLDALQAGAVDFHLKSYESLSANNSQSSKLLIEKIKAVADANKNRQKLSSQPAQPTTNPVNKKGAPVTPKTPTALDRSRPESQSQQVRHNQNSRQKSYKILLIGASTGGPVVVQKILQKLPANFPLPVLVVQHMPATFTGAFAARLNGLSKLTVAEAKDMDFLRPGTALIAPGGKQIFFDSNTSRLKVKVKDADPRVNYQPCVDVTFASAAKFLGNEVLAVVLTGMGADGRDGAKLLKHKGSTIWAQNQQTCVVYGMPMAIVNSGLADKILADDEFSDAIIKELSY